MEAENEGGAELVYKPYRTGFLLQGDRKKHQKLARSLGGRWNSKPVGEQPGWIVAKDREDELKLIVRGADAALSTEDERPWPVEGLRGRVGQDATAPSVPGRKRSLEDKESSKAVSETDSDSSEDEPLFKEPPMTKAKSNFRVLPQSGGSLQPGIKTDILLQSVAKRPLKTTSKPILSLKTDPVAYFKTFALEPREFRRIHGVDGSVCSDSSIDSGESRAEYSPPHKYLASPVTPGLHKDRYKLRSHS